MTAPPLLEISDLSISFKTDNSQMVQAVAGVSFSLVPGKILGIVGESGCGKSVTSLAIMRLLPAGKVQISGRISFEGRNLLGLPESAMRRLRGDRLAMIFQEPMTSLNPSYTVGSQIAETLTCHRGLSGREARKRAIDLLRHVRIPAPETCVDSYPHKLSGGMRQRAMIAMALACQPALLIADEPTTALDVTIQAQMLDLLRVLNAETGAAIILISHDLGVVAEICDEVAVMYAGQFVERGPAQELFTRPQHPYTAGLLGALPAFSEKRARLAAIPGMVPAAGEPIEGCRFSPRCPFALEDCRQISPPLKSFGPAHDTRCLRAPLEKLVA
jgi:peptide/nickel transport system ATP-binding protein